MHLQIGILGLYYNKAKNPNKTWQLRRFRNINLMISNRLRIGCFVFLWFVFIHKFFNVILFIYYEGYGIIKRYNVCIMLCTGILPAKSEITAVSGSSNIT